jgi:hypothetical protein
VWRGADGFLRRFGCFRSFQRSFGDNNGATMVTSRADISQESSRERSKSDEGKASLDAGNDVSTCSAEIAASFAVYLADHQWTSLKRRTVDLPFEIYSIIAGFLTGDSKFGTAANLNIVSKAMRQETLPALYETVLYDRGNPSSWRNEGYQYTRSVVCGVLLVLSDNILFSGSWSFQ